MAMNKELEIAKAEAQEWHNIAYEEIGKRIEMQTAVRKLTFERDVLIEENRLLRQQLHNYKVLHDGPGPHPAQ